MAFLGFRRRKRDDLPAGTDASLPESPATGAGLLTARDLAPGDAAAAVAGVDVVPTVVVAPVDAESLMPRWRRPSLIEARRNDPARVEAQSVRRTFEPGHGSTAPGVERRLVRYRLVSLLDLPDEVSGREIGVLDQGDEVVVLEKRGTYCEVLCPDGGQGWIHKMTLGDVVPPGTI